MSIWAIGDIHGCARTLEALRERIGPTLADHLFFMGDCVDRGPRSREVIDILLRLEQAAADGSGPECTFIRGNHDQMMLDWIDRRAFDESEAPQAGASGDISSRGILAIQFDQVDNRSDEA